MPFKSKAQQRWMFARHPKMAKRWADETEDFEDLPEKKHPEKTVKVPGKKKKASVLTMARLAIASNAFDFSQYGREKLGMDSVTIAAFFEELEKLEDEAGKEKKAIDAQTMRRIGEKAVQRGWSGARETKSIMRLAKAEGRAAGAKILNPHVLEGIGHQTPPTARQMAGTVSHRAPTPRPAAAAPGMESTTAGVIPKAIGSNPTHIGQAPQASPVVQASNLRRNLALGGAAVGGGMIAGHMLPHHQQQQPQR